MVIQCIHLKFQNPTSTHIYPSYKYVLYCSFCLLQLSDVFFFLLGRDSLNFTPFQSTIYWFLVYSQMCNHQRYLIPEHFHVQKEKHPARQ